MSFDRENAVPDCLPQWYASDDAIRHLWAVERPPIDTTIAELSWRDPWIRVTCSPTEDSP